MPRMTETKSIKTSQAKEVHSAAIEKAQISKKEQVSTFKSKRQAFNEDLNRLEMVRQAEIERDSQRLFYLLNDEIYKSEVITATQEMLTQASNGGDILADFFVDITESLVPIPSAKTLDALPGSL